MALKATIYKAEIQIADMDRDHYATHALTLARHPSETEERLMLRILAFALHADADLEFGRGLSTEDEPDLWLKDATGSIEHWIDLGLPEERRLRRAAGRAQRVTLLAYGERAFDVWWRRNEGAVSRLDNLTLWSIPDETAARLASLANRGMLLQFTIQDGTVSVGDDERFFELDLQRVYG